MSSGIVPGDIILGGMCNVLRLSVRGDDIPCRILLLRREAGEPDNIRRVGSLRRYHPRMCHAAHAALERPARGLEQRVQPWNFVLSFLSGDCRRVFRQRDVQRREAPR